MLELYLCLYINSRIDIFYNNRLEFVTQLIILTSETVGLIQPIVQ